VCVFFLLHSPVVTTIAGGNGGNVAGYVDGQGTLAMFNQPIKVVVDTSGLIYVSDSNNKAIRTINTTTGGNVSNEAIYFAQMSRFL
jgi:hypothetical protein